MPSQKPSQEEDPLQNDAVIHHFQGQQQPVEAEDNEGREDDVVVDGDGGGGGGGSEDGGKMDDGSSSSSRDDDDTSVINKEDSSCPGNSNYKLFLFLRRFMVVKVSDIRKDVQCPICLGIIRKTRTVMECLHRFCRECIDKSMRMGNNECPACRTHCASRRSLRDDPKFDALISAMYPNIDQYEKEELAFQEDERVRNKQIQAKIAQTFRRQTEALSKKRRRSQGTYRRRNYRSEDGDDDDANGHDGGKDSSSADERCTERKPKRAKRWRGQPAPLATSGDARGDENDQEVHREMLVWGKGGIRSNTRYGCGTSGNGKHSRGRLARLNDHLRNLGENDNELDIQVVLVSLDEQKEPRLKHSYVCVRSALSVGQLCQFISRQTSFPPEKLEILGVRGLCSESSPLPTMQVQTSSSTAFEASKDKLQVLDSNETLAGLKTACNFARGQLLLAYRQKS